MKMTQEEELVLIVEDDKDLCAILKLVLGKSHKLKIVHTLRDAQRFLQAHVPSHVFLDNNLPDGLGSEFISVVRNRDPSAFIILMTAHNFKNVQARAMENGADLFMQKPFTLAQIRNTMLAFSHKR